VGTVEVTSWHAGWNGIAEGAFKREKAGIKGGAVRAPLSGPYPCGMIELVQQESLSERG
jgi:hypothetical protein